MARPWLAAPAMEQLAQRLAELEQFLAQLVKIYPERASRQGA